MTSQVNEDRIKDKDIEKMQPISVTSRIEGLDITRGVAVFGILIMNIWSFAWSKEAWDYPTILSHLDGATVQAWAVVHILFEGSQRTLFSILFGAGALLLIHRLEQKHPIADVKRIYKRRTAFLVLFGLIDAYIFLWPADILFAYGLCGFVLLSLRNLKTRSLIILVVVLFCIPTALRTLDYQGTVQLKSAYDSAMTVTTTDPAAVLSESQQASIDAWQEKLNEARPDFQNEKFQESTRAMQSGSFMEVFKHQAIGSLILQTVVLVKWWFIDALAAMLIGMVLYRTGVLTLQAPKATYWKLLVLGYGIGLPVSNWETLTVIGADFDPLAQAVTAFTYDVGRVAMAIGHLALILLFCQTQGWGFIKRPMAAVGQMALTNYLTQAIICGFIFYSYGLGLYGKLPGYQMYYVVVAVWALQIVWSIAWLSRFRFGPFEWLWRSLTYGQRQPMKRIKRQ